MPSADRTAEFRELVKEKYRAVPEVKRRKLSRPTRDAPVGAGAEAQATLEKEFVAEAHTILSHIRALARMLANIRKPYLNVDSRAPPFSRQSRAVDLSPGSEQSWANVRHLTNEERDQIDLQARIILSRCADRVRDMETLEKRRVTAAASRTNPIARLLPSRLLPPDPSTLASDFVAAHHASITWYLNRRLAETSEAQKEMQEERMKRQMERTKTLGSGATREALSMASGADVPGPSRRTGSQDSSADSWFGGVPGSLASSFAASIRGDIATSSPAFVTGSLPPSDLDTDSDSEELELTQSQIMQFETENANILRAVQDTLQSVQQAEARLFEISALQTELVAHLTQQTELTDKLYDDAIAATGAVEKGNVQLKEAKRRAKDSRLFILVFLIGASLSLLFLHFY